MQSLIFQATQWRGQLGVAICLTLAYVALRCLLAARAAGGAPRRRLVFCGLGAAVLAPVAMAPALGILPVLVGMGLALLAGGARAKPRPQALLTLTGGAFLLASSGLLACDRIPTLASGPSMWPTTGKQFSLLLMRRGGEDLQRGDRIDFHVPMDEAGTDPESQWPAGNYHKRIVGLPGDEVEVRDYSIWVNGALVADCRPQTAVANLGQNTWLCRGRAARGRGGLDYQMTWGVPDIWMNGHQRWALGPEQILVMGDNLVQSADSRQRGPIHRDWVAGTVYP